MKKKLTNSLMVIVGTFILAFAVGAFLLPGNILSGGVAGVAVLMEPIFHIDKTLMVSLLTYGLFFIGALFLGKEFCIQTILSSLLYPVALSIVTNLNIHIEASQFLLSLYGGLIAGVGVALVLKTGASTGGMDIPPLIIHKYTGIDISKLVMLVDAITVTSGLFIYGIEDVLIGLVSVYTTGIAISKVMAFPGEKAKKVEIITDKWEEINKNINEELSRGTTLFDAKGGYTFEDRKVILACISDKEYPKLVEIIKKGDPKAFVITNDVTEIHGEGFTMEVRV